MRGAPVMKYVRSLRVFSAVCFLSLFLLSSSSTWAQFRAGIQGVVSDSTGAVLPDVKVTLTSQESNPAREATTDASGTYTFNGLGPGGYTVSADKSGFKKVVLDNVVVTDEKMQALDIQLEIGEASQSVTVTAGPAVIDTETGQTPANQMGPPASFRLRIRFR